MHVLILFDSFQCFALLVAITHDCVLETYTQDSEQLSAVCLVETMTMTGHSLKSHTCDFEFDFNFDITRFRSLQS